MNEYKPNPIYNLDIKMTADLEALTEYLAKNVHEVWADSRINEGWVYGEKCSDVLKTHNSLIPYEDLAETEKDYDRKTAISTLKLILSLGYEIKKTK